jgi:uncharacterized protein YjbJ (UPF0337 family)
VETPRREIVRDQFLRVLRGLRGIPRVGWSQDKAAKRRAAHHGCQRLPEETRLRNKRHFITNSPGRYPKSFDHPEQSSRVKVSERRHSAPQAAGTLREKWGELTDNDLAMINGSREILAGRLQERYGIAIEEAQAQARKFAEQFPMADEVATEGGPVTTETLKIGM